VENLKDEAGARQLDKADPLRPLRGEFLFPTHATIGATLAPQGMPSLSARSGRN
jgi:hypothetical protein